MMKVEETVSLMASADDVWRRIRGFGDIADWHPGVTGCTTEDADGAQVRTLSAPGGVELVERLEAYDDDARTFSYSILSSPLPVADYISTVEVASADRGCSVKWSGRFAPSGADEATAEKIVRGIYRTGLNALAADDAA